MNFYASPEYLAVVAEVYFSGRQTDVEDVRIGDEVLRLLVVDRERVITSMPFLDYHEPLCKSEIRDVTRISSRAKFVSRRTIELAEWESNASDGVELAPYIDWTKFPTYDDYKTFILSRQRGLIRENERRGRRLADKFGDLEFTMNDERDDVFEFGRRWKSEQLRETGQRDYFADPKNVAFFAAVRKKGLLVSSTLRAGGRLISVWLGFVHDGVWSGWVFTYDPEFRKYSAGHQLLNAMLEKSYELNHREFDFSIGGESYKSLYATHGRLLETVGQLTLRDRVLKRLKSEAKKNSKFLEAARAVRRAL
jgi:CelD/BcsL family acetyltransferase involved in cellulose biosynthesis